MVQINNPAAFKSKVVGYLGRLEKPEGGFSFAPTAPPGVKDTFYAVSSFRLLGVSEMPRDATIRWVAKEPFHPEAPLSTIAALVELHRLFDLKLPQGDLSLRVEVELQKPAFPNRLFNLVLIAKAAFLDSYLPTLQRLANDLPLSAQSSDTSESLYYKAMVKGVRDGGWVSEVKEWIDSCRNGDGGYGCRPDTTSFLEHVYWALRLMELAGITLEGEERETTLQFVLGSQSRRGGFGRAPEGVPFIESTYQALWILRFLGLL
jgi:hypothetical protein